MTLEACTECGCQMAAAGAAVGLQKRPQSDNREEIKSMVSDTTGSQCLVPFLDMLNHSCDAPLPTRPQWSNTVAQHPVNNDRAELNQSRWLYQLYAHSDERAGEQVRCTFLAFIVHTHIRTHSQTKHFYY